MGRRLKALRARARLSQPRLARAAGVSVWTLRNWENGRRTMLFDAAVRLAAALGVTVGVLAGTEPMPAAKKGGKG